MNAQERTLPKHLSIRGIDPALAKALAREKKRRGVAMNQTVLDLLRSVLGLGVDGKPFDNGLGKFAGGWTESQFQEFQKNTASFNQIDEDLWK